MGLFSGAKRGRANGPSDEALLGVAVENSLAVIWFDEYGDVLRANDHYLELMALDDATVNTKRVKELIGQGRSGQSPDAIWAGVKEGVPQHEEITVRTGDGRTLWISATLWPIKDEDGAVKRIAMAATDITERQLEVKDAETKTAAINASYATIEFTPSGEILTANENFLDAMGYALDEVRGQHHRIFMSRAEAGSEGYAAFWSELGQGEAKSGIFRRVSKSGEPVWLQAVYSAIKDDQGIVQKVVKVAADITRVQQEIHDLRDRIEAVSRSQAVIEFDAHGVILEANKNFLDTVGYRLDEIAGQHHRIFVDPEEAASPEYADFWAKLNRGYYDEGHYRRFGKDGHLIVLQAMYNPIRDPDGKVVKVVKFATDITERHLASEGMAKGLRALANNDADVRMGPEVAGEFAELRESFNSAMVQREELASSILTACERMLSDATELSSNSNDLSRRAENQAATLQETAAAMEQISSTVNSTAVNAEAAESAARSASEQAGHGQDVVAETIQAMERIEDGSRQISSIVETINAISFQTNLLALNAGVEAARAGDAGRGFAVVASEVRALAQRAAEASKEIETLIAENSKQVSDGVGHVTRTGDVLSKIVEAVGSVMSSVVGITQAASEQVTGIKEISTATTEMDQTTQLTAQLAEGSASSAEALTDQARGLLDLANAIRTSDDDNVQAAAWDDAAA